MDVVGTTKVRGCCTFLWMQDERAQRRVVFARPYHCAACVGEMVRSARLQRITVAGSIPMDRVKESFERQKAQLPARWQRQLAAADEAGFALDPATAEVLPRLLDAAVRALGRPFQAPPDGAPPDEPRRAAMQCSLLGDFLFDAALEGCPELNAAQQRLLSDALAHAAVEVLVRDAAERAEERRRRDDQKLARLFHELRNSATAAQLAVDLLRRKGDLQDGKAARALQSGLDRLCEGIEDSLLDDALFAGGLRRARVRLGPVLADAHSAAGDLGARDKKLTVRFARPASALQVDGDPRVVRPAVRGLLQAALQLARPGTTVHLGAVQEGSQARVEVLVDACLSRAGKRVAALPSLAFARRAARAHGGSVSARVSPHDGCELRLDLPRVQQE